jgi:O-antigen/teichoic acid export membrane protein
LLAATILWQMPAGLLRNIYRTTGDYATTVWLMNLQFVGTLAGTVILLLKGGGVLELALWNVVPAVVFPAVIWLSLRRSNPELLPKLSEARLEGLRELLEPSLLFGLIMISYALTLQGPVLLVSREIGGTAVALLVTSRTLANFVLQAIKVFQLALWPELTRLGALGDDAALQFGHRLFAVSAVTICTAFCGALWFEGSSVVTVWTDGKLTPDPWLLRFLLLALVLQMPWMSSSLFTTANNRHRRLAYSQAISAILTLTTIALLLRHLGLVAVPLGAIAGEGIACYHFVIKDACNVLTEDYPRFALRIWAGVAIISFSAWSVGYLGHTIAMGPAPLQWLEVGALTSGASGLAAWSFALRKHERSQLALWAHVRLAAFQKRESKQAA